MVTITAVTTADRARRCIAEQFGIAVAEVQPQCDLFVDFGADSLDIVELVMALEDEFGFATVRRARGAGGGAT